MQHDKKEYCKQTATTIITRILNSTPDIHLDDLFTAGLRQVIALEVKNKVRLLTLKEQLQLSETI
jgi:hypothetical protein